MTTDEDGRIRVKPASPKSRTDARSQRFVSQVLRQVSKSGANPFGGASSRPASTFGRGRVAAHMASGGLGPNARRVVIKSRFVVLKRAGAKSVSTHLRYIERDGVTRDGRRGQAYGADTDTADLQAFEERGRGDRHQFRFIVSVEDAEQLGDLRGYTRGFMQRMAADLETRLDWVAVDHWDTDNPHTHIVLLGRASNGQDLVIAPDYMAHGMRARASELATEWLGPRTELESRQGLLREVENERLTSLDRALLRQANADIVDPGQAAAERQRQTMLRARLQRLEAMGLAERIDANSWRLSNRMEATLTAMGDRGDILRAMHRAMQGQQRDFVTETGPTVHVIGRIAGKGLADEMNDQAYLVVDGIDGRAHYLGLRAGTDLAGLPLGGIVEAKSAGQERPVDRAISSVARDGVYRTADHLEQLRREAAAKDPEGAVNVHVSRLEALRRAGIVERMADGVWSVPTDLVSRGQVHDARKTNSIDIDLRSSLPLDRQIRAVGATWLDRQLVLGGEEMVARGFGSEVREAMKDRVDFLIEHGLAERRGQRVVLARDLLSTLRNREVEKAGKDLQEQTGLSHRPLADGTRVSGVYRRSIQLASGRFAMLEDGNAFSLVPWRPVLEQRLGQSVTAVMRGSGASWQFGRRHGPAI